MDSERLGQQLRAAREARELTLEDVEQALRIRIRFLEAFETGAYEDLPGAVQARGFLRNYARFLRLDDDAILADYDSIQQALPVERRTPYIPPRVTAAPPPMVPPPPPDQPAIGAVRYGRGRRAGVFLGALLGLVLLLGLCLGGTRLVEQLLNSTANQAGPDLVNVLPTVPSLTPSATFVPSMTPLPGARVIDGATPITDRVVLKIEVVQRTFTRVTVDGTVAFEGTVRPGTQLEYQAQQTLTLEASNGAGLDVVFNNLPIGALGGRGEAVTVTFTPELALTPLPTPEPSTATLPPPDSATSVPGNSATVDAASSGKAGQGGDVPTALPLPDIAREVTGGAPEETIAPAEAGATVEPGVSTEAGLTALPTQAGPVFEQPTSTSTSAPSATPTRTPTLTVTPSPTLSPTPTAVLPPRQTNTPIPQKQG